MKKPLWRHYLLLILAVCIAFPNASALFDHVVVDDSKKDQWGYPAIEIRDIINQKISNYKLIGHTPDCLINCQSVIEICQYFDGNLADSIEFKDSAGNPLTMKALKLSINYSEEYNLPIEDKEICQDVDRSVYNEISKKNETKKVNECSMTYKNEIKTKESFKDYDYKSITKGCYKLKIEAKKDPMQKLDWIIESKNIKLTSFAWWSASWAYKKQITLSGNIGQNYTTEINVSFVAGHMNADWSDIRFIDNAEARELGFRNVTQNATDATFHVRVDSADPIYMYYGNAGASSTAKWRDAYQCGDDFNDNQLINITTNFTSSFFNLAVSGGQLNATNNGNVPNLWKCNNSINYQNYTFFSNDLTTLATTRIAFRFDSIHNAANGYEWDDHTGAANPFYWFHTYSATLTEIGARSGSMNTLNQFHNHTIIVNGTEYKLYRDGSIIKDVTDANVLVLSSAVGIGSSLNDGISRISTEWYYVMPNIGNFGYSVGAELNSNALDVVCSVQQSKIIAQ